jgi:hypothetical protein
MSRACSANGEKRNAYKVLVRKPYGKRPLRRPRRRRVDNIKIGGMDWIDLVQDRDQWRTSVNTLMNLRVPENAGKFLNSCTVDNFSRMAQLRK